MVILMIKTVSFNDISQIKTVENNGSSIRDIKTKREDGQSLENQYLSYFIYLNFNYKDHFNNINTNFLKNNKLILIQFLDHIMDHLKNHSSYHFYKYRFKIYKNKKEDMKKLYQLLEFIETL